jgi:class 3 adenylate cyclase
MTQISQQTVLFADLRGSTALFESLGNAEATSVVTQCVAAAGRAVVACGGHVVKTLGDGLMAVFSSSASAVSASAQMHELIEALPAQDAAHGAASAQALPGRRGLKLQVGVARGEVVGLDGDCYGDAVNVAARLLDHAGDNETLITADVMDGLPVPQRSRFRRLDRVVLRGRVEPVEVFLSGGSRGGDAVAATQFGNLAPTIEPDGLRLVWLDMSRVFASAQMPVVLGRSPQATFCVDDSRVSRSHARVDWHGGAFQLSDLSYNGSYVRFADGDIVSLRRGSCALHGSGSIGLGTSPGDPTASTVRFEVLRFADTTPQTDGLGPRI